MTSVKMLNLRANQLSLTKPSLMGLRRLRMKLTKDDLKRHPRSFWKLGLWERMLADKDQSDMIGIAMNQMQERLEKDRQKLLKDAEKLEPPQTSKERDQLLKIAEQLRYLEEQEGRQKHSIKMTFLREPDRTILTEEELIDTYPRDHELEEYLKNQ